MKDNYTELDKQIIQEGDPTWGCKDGVLDVEEVRDFIKELKNNQEYEVVSFEKIDRLAGVNLL